MAKKRVPSPPPPVESSEEESGSSSAGEEELPTNPADSNPNEEEIEEEEEDVEEEEEDVQEEEVEEEESAEEEEESAEEEEDTDNKTAAAAAPAPAPNSGSGSGSESESESDSDPPMEVKPISSKPMPEPGPGAAKKPEAEKASSVLFQRVWSLDDEIALLNGVLDFKTQTGSVPPSTGRKLGAEFPTFIKKYLRMDASEVQVSEKIRRLRKKYDNAAARSSPQFATPHDRTTFEISEKIWGVESAGAAATAANGKESPSTGNGYPFLKEAFAAKGWDFAAVMALEKLDPVKARALEEKFKKQKMAVMKHHLQRMELQKETVKLLMDGMDKTL